MNPSRGIANVPGSSRPKIEKPGHRQASHSSAATLDRCGLGVLRRLHQRAESRGIIGRNVGQDLAVQLDACHLEPVDELRLAGAVLLCGCVDAHDPQ